MYPIVDRYTTIQFKQMSRNIQSLYTLKSLAGQHLKNGRYAQAMVYFKDILARFPSQVGAITSEKEMERAIRELELASHKNLSLCYLKLYQWQRCIEECKIVLDIEPNNLKIIYRIGRSHIQLKNYQTAEHYLRRGFYLDSQEKEIMKALQQIEQEQSQSQRESKKSNWSVLEAIKWMISLLFALLCWPFKSKSKKVVEVQDEAETARLT